MAPPTSVTVAGDLQSELGCPGDWQPDCAGTHLAYDATDGVWQGAFTVPAGSWQYKAAVNDSLAENYGRSGQPNGAAVALSLAAPAAVKFYYDHASHWVTDNRNAVIATVAGSFQSELGCPGDWQPDCLRSWLEDPDGDGTYTFATSTLPAGNYEAKIAINESWDENYGAGGIQSGANLGFWVGPGDTTTFAYDAAMHVLTINPTIATTTSTTTVVASTTSTTSPPPPTFTGSGNPASECYVSIDGLQATKRDQVDCMDGDPACDADGSADSQCAFAFRVCVARTLPGCQPTEITHVKVSPASLHVPVPAVPATAPTCAGEARVTVPLTRRGRRAGKRSLTLVAKNRDRPKRDEDHVLLRCVPNDGSTTGSTSTTTSSTTTTTVAGQCPGGLLMNGGFDAPVTTSPQNGWSFADISAGGWRDSGGDPGGYFALNQAGEIATDPTLRQTVGGLVKGATYRISGSYRSYAPLYGNAAKQDALAVFVESPLFMVLAVPRPSPDPVVWAPFSGTFVAPDTTVTVSLAAERNGDDSSFDVDNLCLTAAPSSYPIGWANLQWPPILMHTISATSRTANVYGQVWIDGVTSQPGPTDTLRAQVGFGPRGSGPVANASWTWAEASFNVDAGNNDEFVASFLPEQVGTFDYVYRYTTTAGREWLYADLNGPVGTGTLPPNPGVLTVSASSDMQPPLVPSRVRVLSASPTAIDLAWDAVAGDPTLYGYEILRGDAAAGPYALLARLTGTSFTDGGVTRNQTYFYVVRSVDLSFNRSSLSAAVQATAATRTATLILNVTVPASTDATGRSVHLAGTLSQLEGGLADWDPDGPVLTRTDATHWTITLTGREFTPLDYLYTLGDWDHLERDGLCGAIANRQLALGYGTAGVQTINDTVGNWRNVTPCGN